MVSEISWFIQPQDFGTFYYQPRSSNHNPVGDLLKNKSLIPDRPPQSKKLGMRDSIIPSSFKNLLMYSKLV
jgi:hypothetical protein